MLWLGLWGKGVGRRWLIERLVEQGDGDEGLRIDVRGNNGVAMWTRRVLCLVARPLEPFENPPHVEIWDPEMLVSNRQCSIPPVDLAPCSQSEMSMDSQIQSQLATGSASTLRQASLDSSTTSVWMKCLSMLAIPFPTISIGSSDTPMPQAKSTEVILRLRSVLLFW